MTSGVLVSTMIATGLAFLSLLALLWWKRIDSNNTVFVSCIILLLYVVSVLALLPADVNDKVILGLISIASGIVGFLARGIFESSKNQSSD